MQQFRQNKKYEFIKYNRNYDPIIYRCHFTHRNYVPIFGFSHFFPLLFFYSKYHINVELK